MSSFVGMSGLSLYESHGESPFGIEGMVLRRVRSGKERIGAISSDGEYLGELDLPKYGNRWHDSKVYVKVFTHHIPELTKNLSASGSNLLWYVIFNIPFGSDSMEVRGSAFLEYMGYGKKSISVYYRALTELLDRGVIARKTGSKKVFWINVNLIFNGDRTRLVKEPADNETAEA